MEATAEEAQVDSRQSGEVISEADARKSVDDLIIGKAMRNETFRQRLLENPKETLEQEFSRMLGKDVEFPDEHEIKVVEEEPDVSYLVLPASPKFSEQEANPDDLDLDPNAGVSHYCTTPGCKPGYSC